MRKGLAALVCTFVVLGPAAGSAPPVTEPSLQEVPAISLTLVTSGLSEPVGAMTAGDGTRRLFVVEQDGFIRIVRKGKLKQRPFLDISDLTEGEGEQGLLGLAFHPLYEKNRRFFVHYTAADGDTVIAEFKRSRSHKGRAKKRSQRVVLQVADPFPNHNGGDLHFGSDGYLYIALGDGGGGGDPEENAQDVGALLGKILRIDVDGREGGLEYALPDDNPFVGREGARGEIWSYGWRNPWRFSFDSATGDMWIADVGQNNFEEINVERVGSAGGANYGWDIMEADRCFEPPEGCDPTGLTLPVELYSHEEGCSVSGGYVYRGDRWPGLAGFYFYGDYCSGSIWALSAANPETRATNVLSTDHRISSFGLTRSGEILVVDHGGRLLKMRGE